VNEDGNVVYYLKRNLTEPIILPGRSPYPSMRNWGAKIECTLRAREVIKAVEFTFTEKREMFRLMRRKVLGDRSVLLNQ